MKVTVLSGCACLLYFFWFFCLMIFLPFLPFLFFWSFCLFCLFLSFLSSWSMLPLIQYLCLRFLLSVCPSVGLYACFSVCLCLSLSVLNYLCLSGTCYLLIHSTAGPGVSVCLSVDLISYIFTASCICHPVPSVCWYLSVCLLFPCSLLSHMPSHFQ